MSGLIIIIEIAVISLNIWQIATLILLSDILAELRKLNERKP